VEKTAQEQAEIAALRAAIRRWLSNYIYNAEKFRAALRSERTKAIIDVFETLFPVARYLESRGRKVDAAIVFSNYQARSGYAH
jgi:hypothetical protein